MNENYIITIGRQLGSGGRQIGNILSEKLGIPCYDKELLTIASQESGVGKEFFEQADEKSTFNLMSGLFGFRAGYIGPNTGNYLGNEALFKIQSDVIRLLAEKESCIFVGRCADYILRDQSRCINFFISADAKDRIQRIVENEKITGKEAQNLMEQIDKKRAGYYNYYSNKVWGMAISYHLCINSSVLGLEDTSSFMIEYIKKKLL